MLNLFLGSIEGTCAELEHHFLFHLMFLNKYTDML